MFEGSRFVRRAGSPSSGYHPEEVHQTAANYAGLGSLAKYYQRAWHPFYLWLQMFSSDPHILPWNVLEPVNWRILDVDNSQLIQLQAIYGQPVNFAAPDIAQLKES